MINIDYESDVPIYLQIAKFLEDSILTGIYEEESQIPSTTELSVTQKINPATVLKGMNKLVSENIIYKKRGLGMFVEIGAVEKIREKRKEEFVHSYVNTMIQESKRLSITKQELIELIERGY